MIDRGEGGKIINVASLLSFQGGITVPGYAAAKGGVVQLTKALANEWASHRINVNAIAPGYMADRQHHRAPRGPASAAGRSPNAFRPAAGARPKISPAPSCSSPRPPPTTCTVTCSSSTAAGWALASWHIRSVTVAVAARRDSLVGSSRSSSARPR